MTDCGQFFDTNDRPVGFRPKKYMSAFRYSLFQNCEGNKMEALARVVDKVGEVAASIGKDTCHLPRIVLVGEQGAGKSSVLEGLIGISLLPRSKTRRPLLIHLDQSDFKSGKGENQGRDYVVFHHLDQIFTDLDQVKEEIVEETERVAGPEPGMSSVPIVMTVHSKNVATNLTLVDLPGLGREDSTVDGMRSIPLELIQEYISTPNTVILVVLSAANNIEANEVLQMTRELDPNEERTLVVVTKLDVKGADTNTNAILSGNMLPSKRPIIGVINRSQRDLMQGKSLQEAAVEEMFFFYNNYPHFAHKHGSSNLTKGLQNLLIEHVKKYLPHLRNIIKTALEAHRNNLKLINGPPTKSQNQTLLQILTNFATAFTSTINGHTTELDTEQLKGGARISYIFHEIFGSALNSIDPFDGFSKSSILTAIRNSAGAKPFIFVPETCFELLIKKQIQRLEAPALRCVQLVYDEMETILYSCENDSEINITRFPKLAKKIHEISVGLLQKYVPETNTIVQNIIAIQSAYINTGHPDFRLISHRQSADDRITPVRETNPAVLVIEQLIISYFEIVKRSVGDLVPKAVMHCLVNQVVERLLPELVSRLYGACHQAEDLLEESIAVIEQRKNATKYIEALERASMIITEINEASLRI